jgi:hypothetical protein
MCQHVCLGGNIGSELECKEARLGDLLVRVTHGNKEAASIGSYMISLYRVYHGSLGEDDDFITGLVRPRDGSVEQVWITQLDKGKEPEIIVWTKCVGSGAYGELDLFRFTGANLVPLPFGSSRGIGIAGYMGHDEFKIKGGVLFRAFPLYKESDCNADPTGGTMKLVLDFKYMKWMPVKK